MKINKPQIRDRWYTEEEREEESEGEWGNKLVDEEDASWTWGAERGAMFSRSKTDEEKQALEKWK